MALEYLDFLCTNVSGELHNGNCNHDNVHESVDLLLLAKKYTSLFYF